MWHVIVADNGSETGIKNTETNQSVATNKISFEVMVLQGGRWEVHGSYPQDRQGQAIKDAKALENISTIKGVKVIREEIDDKTGKAKENNIYASSNLSDEQPEGAKLAKLGQQRGGADAAPAKKPNKKTGPKGKNKKSNKRMRAGKAIPKHVEAYDPDAAEAVDAVTFSFFQLLVKLLMMVLFSAVISSIVSGLAGVWLGQTEFHAPTQAYILNILFFGTFFLSIVWMGFSFLSKAKIRPRRNRKITPPPPAAAPKKLVPFNEETKADPALNLEKKDTGSDPATTGDHPDEILKSVSASEPGSGVEALETNKGDTPMNRAQKAFAMEYLVSALKYADVNKIAMDNFNKFGVNLFIAGAIETLSKVRNLDGNTAALILSEMVKFMGFKNHDANTFPDKIQGYLLADPRYMQMYQAGRSSMITHLEGDPESTAVLAIALTEWNKPKSTETSSSTITVLFTDIAGSTDMTQTLGDALAQQAVRAHNKIVRTALHTFNGKEIKHTGDGIMASFLAASNAAEAATDIQKGALKHTTSNPELPLHLKIGINAGEPIAEEDDLFGTTVQLAARIVDKALADQIFVSEIVRGLCEGKNFDFKPIGEFGMKGFGDKIPLHELIWNIDAEQVSAPVPEHANLETEDTEKGIEIGTDIVDGNGSLETDEQAPVSARPDNSQEGEEIEQVNTGTTPEIPPELELSDKNEIPQPEEANTPPEIPVATGEKASDTEKPDPLPDA